MMKKTISILLCLVLLFSVVTAFAQTSINADKEIDVLNKLGILSGISASDESITRGEFASFTSDLTNIKPMLDETIQFADVPQSHTYYYEIRHVASCNFMNGRSQFIFAPDEPLAFSEAVKVLVELAGYKHVAIYEGGYPAGYMQIASRIGILDGISSNVTLTKNVCFKLIYNLLHVKTIEPSEYYGDEAKMAFNETGKTYLEDVFNIYHIKNVRVTANENTSLTENKGCGKGKVVIDGEDFIDNASAASLLGYNAEIYYIEDADIKTVVYAEKAYGTSETIISQDNLIYLKINNVSYAEGDKILNINLSPSVDFIYNKVFCNFSSLSTDDIDECGLKLVDSDGNGIFDVVFIEKLTNYYIDIFNPNEYKIKDKISDKFIQFNKNADFHVYNSEGKDVGFSGLKTKMLISVFKSKDESSYYIYTSSNSYGGTVTEMDDNGFYFGDTFCPVANELKKSSYMPKLGDMGTVYCDINGRAAMFVLKASEAGNYGYMISAGVSEGLNKKLQMRLLEQNGEFTNYYVSNKCKIDGVTIKGIDDERINHLKIDFNSENKTTPTERFIPQLISYALNSDGEISVIDTEYMDTEHESEHSLFSRCGKSDVGYTLDQYKGVYGGKRWLSTTDLVAFSVPEDYNETDERFYGVYDFQNLQKTFRGAKLKTYNENNVNYSSLVVSYVGGLGSGAVAPNTPLFLVDYVTQAYENEEFVKKIHGFYDGVKIAVYVDDELYRANLPEGRVDLKRGDILRINKDHLNNVTNYTIWYNIDDRYNFDRGLPYNGNYQTETHDCTGTVYEAGDNLMLLGHGWSENLNDAFFASKEFHCASTNSWGGIYLFDEEKDEVRIADSSDIKSYKDYGNEASRLYCFFSYGQCAGLVIIKLKGF